MKTLSLIRHTDSAYNLSADVDRPLTARGKKEAEIIADFYQKVRPAVPGRIEVSPAMRTRSTVEAFVKGWGITDGNINYNPEIYNASMDELMKVIHSWEEKDSDAMIIGHNPGMLNLVNYLINHSPLKTFPPGSIAVVRSRLPWSEWGSRTADLNIYTNPDKLTLKQ